MKKKTKAVKVTYEMEGWGNSNTYPGRRGGLWALYTFDTLKEAKAEQRKQLRDQKFRNKKRAALAKNLNEEFVLSVYEYPVYKVTREQVP